MAPNPDQKRLREVKQKLMRLREEQERIKADREALRKERDELMSRLGREIPARASAE
jgi:predicted transcriptional regulator